MTSLNNYLYHQRMARLWALSDARDIDFRTPGTIDQMTDERNKYSVNYRKPEFHKTDSSDLRQETDRLSTE